MTGHVTAPPAALADRLPSWVTLLRAPNPGPMTLDGTNTWVLRAPGQERALVIDPGPDDPGHLTAVAGHAPAGLILLTHGHPDHTDGVPGLRARLGVPVAGAETDLGGYGFEIERLDTPGHTNDSVCFLVGYGAERVIFTGDTILGRGTTVVAHPDGDLGDYLASLTRLSTYQGIPALPGHGPALADCGAAAEFYLAHRRARLDQVRAAVAAGAATPPEVVAMVYADTDRALWPAAEWSVAAQLAYLAKERESRPGVGGLDLP